MAITPETEPWDALLQSGRDDERLVHDDVYEGRPAGLASIPDELNWQVTGALERAGIEHLYRHQVDALHKAFDLEQAGN